MILAKESEPVVTMEEVTDPVELDRARAQHTRAERNWAWFKSHAADIYSQHRGKVVCVAGQEVFAADITEKALALAEAAHPDDDGRFLLYIPKEKMWRIYAHHGRLAGLPG